VRAAFFVTAFIAKSAAACPFCGGGGAGETASAWIAIAVLFFVVSRALRTRE
jgi:hypothetical protein